MRRYSGIPTDFTARYFCPDCRTMYMTREEAIECFNANEEPVYKVGDIIRLPIGYSWYDGDERWLLLGLGYEFHGKPTHDAYFVVTAITFHDHRIRYSIKTLGIKNGNPTGLCGWTSKNHFLGTRIENPDPFIVEQSQPFIGEIYQNLI